MVLLEKQTKGKLSVTNRMVMAPMTRARANNPEEAPTDLHATYYAQRASAGLIISEAIHISPQARGYIHVPGLWTDEQVKGWRQVTEDVHDAGGQIFAQLFHTGRMSHGYFQPGGVAPKGVSSKAATGYQATILSLDGSTTTIDYGQPVALTTDEVKAVVQDFAHAIRNAKAAGFDGVEIHAANGYLIEQFLNGNLNDRHDEYGGSIPNRIRLCTEITTEAIKVFGPDHVGVRISPFGLLHDQPTTDDTQDLYFELAKALNELEIGYLHWFDQKAFGVGGQLSNDFKAGLRSRFSGLIIGNGGYDFASAEAEIESGNIDLVAFGRLFLANPDLVERYASQTPTFNPLRAEYLYTPGPVGYTDYPKQ